MDKFGTNQFHGVIDGMEYEAHAKTHCPATAGACEPFCIEFSRRMSMVLTPLDGEVLPELGADGHYVVECFPSTGQKRTVVERENNIISLEEARTHIKE